MKKQFLVRVTSIQLYRFYYKHPAMAQRKARFKIAVSLLLLTSILLILSRLLLHN